MAKLEKPLNGDFSQWLNKITNGVLSSISATLEDTSFFSEGDGPIRLFAISAGGSQELL